MNELMRQREAQEEARREYERQLELRSKVADEELSPLCACDREYLLEMGVIW
jgi:hypothetical protein